jgi:RNA 2',3'-cyclic 3'-phosphodiesterase
MASPDQLPMFGFQPRQIGAGEHSSVFFALRPDEATAQQIHAMALRLRDANGLRGKLHSVDTLHVTLCYLGDFMGVPPELLEGADLVGRAQRAMPFELAFDRILSFHNNRKQLPVVLCRADDCAPLTALRARLGAALSGIGRKYEPRSFRAHVTLLYDTVEIPEQQVGPISWTVRELLLVRSLIGQGHHEVLARYPLTGA